MTITETKRDTTERGRMDWIDFTTEGGTRVAIFRGTGGDYTVYYRYVPKSRRTIGKTFFSADEMIAHYKTIRPELLEAMRALNAE